MDRSSKIKMTWDSLTFNSLMKMCMRKCLIRQTFACIAFLSAILVAVLAFCQTANTLQALNIRFAEISDAYHKEAAKNLAGTSYIKKDLKALRAHLLQLRDTDDALANAMLLANLPLVLSNIGSKSTPFFLNQLLKQDMWSSAKRLADSALEEGGSLTSSRVNYLLGEYFFDREELDKATGYLSAIEFSEALTPIQRDYAALMFGIALQKTKKHRQALKVYERIELDRQATELDELDRQAA